MRICLIHAKINYDNMEPVGLLRLATVLKEQGHEVLVLDIFPGVGANCGTRVGGLIPTRWGTGSRPRPSTGSRKYTGNWSGCSGPGSGFLPAVSTRPWSRRRFFGKWVWNAR